MQELWVRMEGVGNTASNGLVTVATFWDVFDADFVKMMLDLDGIPSVLEDKHMVLLS